MANIESAKETIEKWQEELEAMTGSVPNPNFDPNKPEGPDNQRNINGEFSCEKLQELIGEHVDKITAMIQDKVASFSELMGTWAAILNVPGNPLKIIKWALKVAFGPAAEAVFLAIATIKSMIQLIVAIVGLVSAIAQAAAKLAACLENAIRDAIQSVIDEVLNGAADLLSQAEGMVDQLMADLLEESGIQDVLDTVDDISAEIDGGINDLVGAGEELRRTRLNARGIKPQPLRLNLPGGIG
jgi:phage-related protein